jgi:hypothetical protein
LTNAVQTLAGVLLPSASVFLLLLCNDRAVLGPWAKSRNLNLFTGVVVAALVMLSRILTLSVLFTGITESQLLAIFIGGCIAAAVTAIGVRLAIPARPPTPAAKAQGPTVVADRVDWRMPPRVAFCVSPICPITHSIASAGMKQPFGAKPARSCLQMNALHRAQTTG